MMGTVLEGSALPASQCCSMCMQLGDKLFINTIPQSQGSGIADRWLRNGPKTRVGMQPGDPSLYLNVEAPILTPQVPARPQGS